MAMQTSKSALKMGFPFALFAVLSCAVVLVYSQTPPKGPAALSQGNYLTASALPPAAGKYLRALGDRLSVRGSERVTLVGTATDQRGTGPAQLIWELPGNVRLDRQTNAAVPLIFATASGALNASALSQPDRDLLENLAFDTQEAFLYSFRKPFGHRLLGTRFRADDGKSKDYNGPFYDLYEILGAVPVAQNVVRQKWFFFDSATGLLVKARYLVQRGGPDVAVEAQFGNWANQGGKMFPAKIIRTENGTAVFTFQATQGTVGPAVADGAFGGH